MKKIILILASVSIIFNCIGQAPQLINYQGVARDNSGLELPNQNISLRLSILSGSSSGLVVYSETHTVTTNSFGLFDIHIGGGSLVSGTFSTIDWGGDLHFFKTELDPAGGSNYSVMGTTQFVSVPYALNASSVTISSPNGTFWNLTVDNNGVFNADQVCSPAPTNAYAGVDQLNVTGTSATLSANTPTQGTGTWSILSGTGGAIANPSNVASGFSGLAGEVYVLRWAITNTCGTSYDDVTVSFAASGFTLPNCNCQGQTLYVYPSDNSTNNSWHANNLVLVGPSAQTPNDGEQNTNAIIAINGSSSTYAPQTCYNLNAYGYSDWYLPSKDELNCIYQNMVSLGNNFNTSNNSSSDYWSSTEYNAGYAWAQKFYNGSQFEYGKGTPSTNTHVRCVRKNP